MAVAFSPDGKFLATASNGRAAPESFADLVGFGTKGEARLWSTALADMLHQLCTG